MLERVVVVAELDELVGEQRVLSALSPGEAAASFAV